MLCCRARRHTHAGTRTHATTSTTRLAAADIIGETAFDVMLSREDTHTHAHAHTHAKATLNRGRCFFCGSFLLFMIRVCLAFLPVHCSFLVTCWERANLLALLHVMFVCGFVTFPCGVLRQVWYLIASISDLCLLGCPSSARQQFPLNNIFS